MQSTHTPKIYSYSLGKSVAKRLITLGDVQEFFNSLSVYGLFGIKSYLEAGENEKEWQKLIFSIASTSINGNKPNSTCKVDLDGISLCITADAGNGILVNGLPGIPRGLSFDQLQGLMRIAVVQNSHLYPGEKQVDRVERIRQYVAVNDLADVFGGKVGVQDLDGQRLKLFNANCLSIFNGLIPVHKKKSDFPVQFSLSAHSQIGVRKHEFVLIMDDCQVKLAIQFDVFFENLRSYNEKLNPYPNITAENYRLYRQHGWQGALYNKNNPSPAELHPLYKSMPYRSVTLTEPRALNGKVFVIPDNPYEQPTEKIFCAGLVYQFLKDALENPEGKIDWRSHYQTVETLSAHISADATANWHSLIANAYEPHLIDNDRFGHYLLWCFSEMLTSEKNESVKVIVIVSTVHTMGMVLRKKMVADKPVIEVTYFEPGVTNEPVRCIYTGDPSLFETQTLELYINGAFNVVSSENSYEHYYGEEAKVSMVMECGLSCFTGDVIMHEKKLVSFASEPLTPTHMYHLLNCNCAQDIVALASRFQQIEQPSHQDIQELTALLAAVNPEGFSGLHMALLLGCTEAIGAFGVLFKVLLTWLPENEYQIAYDIVAAKDPDGIPGLHMAFQNGCAGAIRAFGSLLKLLPVNQCAKIADLIASKCSEGRPGLFMAALNGHEDAFLAGGELIDLLPLGEFQKKLELANAKTADSSALKEAAEIGCAGIVGAHATITRKILASVDF